jgi:hypothetical protein
MAAVVVVRVVAVLVASRWEGARRRQYGDPLDPGIWQMTNVAMAEHVRRRSRGGLRRTGPYRSVG